MGDKIYVPYQEAESEFVEKRSRFIGHVWPVDSEDQAQELIRRVKKQHYDARHNCWCYLLGGSVVRYSDDGEPQGTAGIPMLEVFRREGVSDFVCVVTRYFGGVLLGAGGLLRAYTRSAKDALDAAGISVVRRWLEAELPCSYGATERLKAEVAAAGGAVAGTEYGAEVVIKALIPGELREAFCARIFDVSGGAVSVRITGETLRAAAI